ncbi:MAG: hypothetical protein ABW137_20050, partial [Mycobacterium sp.]
MSNDLLPTSWVDKSRYQWESRFIIGQPHDATALPALVRNASTILALVIGLGVAGGVVSSGTARAACFQQGGYNPPACATSTPAADEGKTPDSSPGTDPSANQSAPVSPSTGQSDSGQGAHTPPDSGVTACQNQSAMAVAIGLQPTTCRPTQGPNTPPDSG